MADILRSGTESLLPTLSFAEQRAFLGTAVAYPVSHLLSMLGQGRNLKIVYERIFPLKGILVEALRREAALSRVGALDLENAPMVERLRLLRSEISGLQLARDPGESQDRVRRRRDLEGEKEQLERLLVSSVGEARIEDPAQGVGFRDLQRLLQSDEAIVDIYRYQDLLGDAPVDQYGAVVVLPSKAPLLIRLGDSAEVHNVVEYWRNLVLLSRSGPEPVNQAWEAMAVLVWRPVAKILPAGIQRVWLSPDDELSRVPWQLFPAADPDAPERLVAQIDSVRELVRLRRESPRRRGGRLAALIAGGIDFDAGAEDLSGRFSPLLASAKEADQLGGLGAREGLEVEILKDAEARKEDLLARISRADYIHIATHGYFARTELPLFDSHSLAWLDGLREPWIELVGRTRSPLAESGIALSGANGRVTATGEAPGLLSAEELIGVDLSRARLVTLSACETGRGEEATGQGVLGLRASLLAAGARSLVMSLWKVPDEATEVLMNQFYTNLWQRKLPPLQALLDAQKALRHHPSGEFAAPANWAGWILVGEAW